MPEFQFTIVENYKKATINNEDFKGKWLILDFWETGCASCIKSFPTVNAYQKEFKNDLNIILVGSLDNNFNTLKGTKTLYGNLQRRENLNLISVYDSTFWNKWGIWIYPYTIIIDPLGIIKAITFSSDLTRAKIKSLLEGGSPEFVPVNRKEFDGGRIAGALSNLIDSNILYRSIFCKSSVNDEFTRSNIDYQIIYEKEVG
ncbi:MAG TPA: TlpA disulfide reductase family protein, partial [Aquella sp.]|nr:TlpA disulfide reductase family protein [Aquella sp.]